MNNEMESKKPVSKALQPQPEGDDPAGLGSTLGGGVGMLPPLSLVLTRKVRAEMISRYEMQLAEFEYHGRYDLIARVSQKLLSLRMEEAAVKRNRWLDPEVQGMAAETATKLAELKTQLEG